MDCVLINPMQNLPYVDYHHNGLKIDNRMNMPIGLAYCAALLEKSKFSVKIIDANFLRISNEKVVESLNDPKFVVLTTSPIDRWECPYINIYNIVVLSDLIKKKFSNTKIVLIGPHGSTQPEWVFNKCKSVDFIIRGEPEITLLNILYNKYKKGLSTREKNYPDRELLVDIDKLPMPAFHLLPMEEYLKKKGWAYLLSSRGCLFKCTFCFRKMFGDNFRCHSVKRVVDEMELLVNKYGFSNICFYDLEFSINKERVKEICKEIIKRNLKVKWICNVRWNDLDDELLSLMKQAGCYKVKPGIESCSETILKNIQKGINKEMILKGIELLKKHNMQFDSYGMLLLPGETMKTLEESIDFQAKHNLGFGGAFVIPYPGTALFEQAKHQTNNPNLTWDDIPALTGKVGTSLLEKHSVNQIFRKVRVMYFEKKFGTFFYLKPKFWTFLKKKIAL